MRFLFRFSYVLILIAGVYWRDAFTGMAVGFVTPLSLDPYEYRILRSY